ncbi:MAG TPA: site-2 protease family protein [bacterium]|nr:site-2 protease family protein [bacterium]
MTGSFRIARILGIPIEVHYTWLIVFGLVVWSLAVGYFPTVGPNLGMTTVIVLSVSATLLFFAALLLHELAHSYVAIREGLSVRRITLFIFGGVAQMAKEPSTAGGEFRMAIAGPLVSIAIGVISWVLSRLAGEGPVGLLFRYLGFINLVVAVFNLIPAFPLDGGRVLRSSIWYFSGDLTRATLTATSVGQGFAYLLIGLGVLQVVAGRAGNGIWMMFIGWFLLQAAQSGYQQVLIRRALRGLKVRDVVREDAGTVPSDITLATFVHDYLLPSPDSEFVVVDDGRLRGLISLEDVKKVSRERWGQVTVADAMVPESECPTVSATQNAYDAFMTVAASPTGQAVVKDGSRLVGAVTRRDLLARLRNRLALEE